jgi:hypothetical protein
MVERDLLGLEGRERHGREGKEMKERGEGAVPSPRGEEGCVCGYDSVVAAAVGAQMPTRRAGEELVADALEWGDTAVALWALVDGRRVALVDRVEYHVDDPGGMHHLGEIGVHR